ncbi:hypothetical protein SKAU_G00301030 [Synaphobranchus kaupii]|uniref:Uncharacterized protein n=1 Tax=Synaphobranchus kaupii TaxID=118154 RepID=A0A9Q1IL57_SYNKA|nr:hypothetical protein SKAU_G00301030 [Synaphobranchus kaupii]
MVRGHRVDWARTCTKKPLLNPQLPAESHLTDQLAVDVTETLLPAPRRECELASDKDTGISSPPSDPLRDPAAFTVETL